MGPRVTPFLAMVLLLGCDQIEGVVVERYQTGTVAGVERCVKNNDSKLVPGNTTLNLCAEKHAKAIPVYLGGRAGYKVDWRDMKVEFGGTLENKRNHFVVTKVMLLINHADFKDKDGKPGGGEFMLLENMWLPPGQNYVFSRPPMFMPEPGRFASELNPSVWTWQVSTVCGVTLNR
jgi:hypothetical protein